MDSAQNSLSSVFPKRTTLREYMREEPAAIGNLIVCVRDDDIAGGMCIRLNWQKWWQRA